MQPNRELIPQLGDPGQQAQPRKVIHIDRVVAQAPVGVQHQQDVLPLQQARDAALPAQWPGRA